LDNPEKLATKGTQDEEKHSKNTTHCVEHHNMQANTNNVDMTRALIKSTGGKEEPNIIFMQKS
jgi:hypothetical protein